MKVLLDTSVLYPATAIDHAYHRVCAELLTKLQRDHQIVILNTHLIAELYANMTRTPKIKITPDAARKILRGMAVSFEGVDLDIEDYLLAVDRCADLALTSGIIYDALHFQAAIKANVDVLYTGNLRDFQRLMTDEITFRIESPY